MNDYILTFEYQNAILRAETFKMKRNWQKEIPPENDLEFVKCVLGRIAAFYRNMMPFPDEDGTLTATLLQRYTGERKDKTTEEYTYSTIIKLLENGTICCLSRHYYINIKDMGDWNICLAEI